MIRQGVDSRSAPSFSLRNRLARLLWALVYQLLFKWIPTPFHGIRAGLLRCFGAQIGRGCHVYPRARIWAPWNLIMDDHACLANDVICYSMAPISIGKNVVVSQGAHLCAGTHDYESPTFQLYARPIIVADSVWICAEAFVGPGVEIGEGAVLGARAVASKRIPPWTVWAGNPAHFVKERKFKAMAAEAATTKVTRL